MRIPSKQRERAEWAGAIIRACNASRNERIQRGQAFRNIYLTGSGDGIPQTFLRTHDFICDLLAVLYSPSSLRFSVDYFGQVSPAERAKGKAASAALLQHIIDGDIDDLVSELARWSLIKGKSISQLTWSRGGLEGYLIQPEAFGVYNESISTLARQEAFTHTTFPTRSRFLQMISGLPREKQNHLMKAVDSQQVRMRDGEDGTNTLKQIVVGGLYPYTTSGTPVPASQSQGIVTHLFAPSPVMQPSVSDALVPLVELWAWNDLQDDWATITMMGDEIVFGEDMLYNAFSHDILTQRGIEDNNNPLRGKHGFTEFCPLPLDGFFWGMSYVYLVALLQESINKRIDGINTMLRKQEDPPRFVSGTTSINQNAYAKLNKPGGYFTDGSPNAKIADLIRDVPADIWRSFHELNAMFDTIGGFPPIMRGEGEGSVRSQGQSDVLLRTGAARHLDPALKIERSIERLGATAFDILRAKDNTILTAWLKPGKKSIQSDIEPDPTLEPPAEGMTPISFQYKHVSDRAKITVDSHSASPAFRHEQRELAFGLARIGAAGPAQVVEMVHPPMEDELLEAIEEREVARAKLIQQHPELLGKQKGGHK